MKKVGVAILGLGVVGGGTYRILTENRAFYRDTQGLDVSVECVLERNPARAEALGVPAQDVAGSIEEVVSNPNVDIVVEVIGGVEPAHLRPESAPEREIRRDFQQGARLQTLVRTGRGGEKYERRSLF